MTHRLAHGDTVASAAGFSMWALGTVAQSGAVQWIGALVGVAMCLVGVSREVRAWLDRRAAAK